MSARPSMLARAALWVAWPVASVLTIACGPGQAPPLPAATQPEASPATAAQTAAPRGATDPEAFAPINPPPGGAAQAAATAPVTPAQVVARAQLLARAQDRAGLAALITPQSRDALAAIPEAALPGVFGHVATGDEVERNGPRLVLRLGRGKRAAVIGLIETDAGWRIDLALSRLWKPAEAGEEAADNVALTVAEATRGLEGPPEGRLTAALTVRGYGMEPLTLTCRLFEARAPRTVANFVGLARGLRAFVDPKTGSWARRPLYDGLPIHRVVTDTLIQTGDPRGTGRGGPGFGLADELDTTLRFDRAGVLAMAGRGPNTAGSQFFITARALPELDYRSSIFGVCDPPSALTRLSRWPTEGEVPSPPLTLDSVVVRRTPR